MESNMTPEDRQKLIDDITAKLPEMDDDTLMTIATQNGLHVESAAEKMTKDGPAAIPPVIDTKMLTGPVNKLKNFLINKTRDNDMK